MFKTKDSPCTAVRRFNRFYTEAIGVLADEHLGTGLTLGQSRILFEIGQLGCVDIHTLRMHLGLDSGYLSRALAVLVDEKLVRTKPLARDRRVKLAMLTHRGQSKLEQIERRSEQSVTAWLQPLDAKAQERLVTAMSEIQGVLMEQVEIEPSDADSPEARACLTAYFSELAQRFPDGFDPAKSVSAAPGETRPPNGQFLLLWRGGHPLGCGAVKTLEPRVGEIKRMWIHPKLRGLGLGRRLLIALEGSALELGFDTVRLDTSERLKEAIALYRLAGYNEIAAYNDNPYAAHWFEKRLVTARDA